jgi:hypothetical protein
MDELGEATYERFLSEQEGEQGRLHAHAMNSSTRSLLRYHEYMMRLLCFQPACSKESHIPSDHMHRQARFLSIVDALNHIYGRDTLFFAVQAMARHWKMRQRLLSVRSLYDQAGRIDTGYVTEVGAARTVS